MHGIDGAYPRQARLILPRDGWRYVETNDIRGGEQDHVFLHPSIPEFGGVECRAVVREDPHGGVRVVSFVAGVAEMVR